MRSRRCGRRTRRARVGPLWRLHGALGRCDSSGSVPNGEPEHPWSRRALAVHA